MCGLAGIVGEVDLMVQVLLHMSPAPKTANLIRDLPFFAFSLLFAAACKRSYKYKTKTDKGDGYKP